MTLLSEVSEDSGVVQCARLVALRKMVWLMMDYRFMRVGNGFSMRPRALMDNVIHGFSMQSNDPRTRYK